MSLNKKPKYFGREITFPSKQKLIEDWEKVKTLKEFFHIWTWAYPCPSCGFPKLDFSNPTTKHAIICRNCHKTFDLIESKDNKESNGDK